MFRLFTHHLSNRGEIDVPNILRLRNVYKGYYDYYLYFLTTHPKYINSNHLLIKVLYTLMDYVTIKTDLHRLIEDNHTKICSAARITSSFTKGMIYTKLFYTTNCAVLSTTFTDKQLDWRNERPVRCLNHPFTTMEIFLPPLGNDIIDNRFSAIGIDLFKLARQLRGWLHEQDTNAELTHESLSEFIGQYVLPGMMPEQIDIALRNRIIHLALGEDIPDPTKRERQNIKSIEETIDHELTHLLVKLRTRRLPYYNTLEQIPLLFSDNVMTRLPYEINELSMYSYWLLLLVYVDWFYLAAIVANGNQTTTNIHNLLLRVDRFIYSTDSLTRMPTALRETFIKRYEESRKKISEA